MRLITCRTDSGETLAVVEDERWLPAAEVLKGGPRTIVELGHGMRLETIAEGIETAEQLERLRMLDCELGQGYHFSVPLGGAELTAYLERTLEVQRRAA